MAGEYYEGIGRRKTSSARVRLHVGGTGSIVVNDKPAEEYFGREIDLRKLKAPLLVAGAENAFNVTVKVEGGGITGQADSSAMCRARALVVSSHECKGTWR